MSDHDIRQHLIGGVLELPPISTYLCASKSDLELTTPWAAQQRWARITPVSTPRPATKTVSFAAGSATATVTVDTTADTTIEANETGELTLTAGTGYSIGTTGAVVAKILNDEIPSLINYTLCPAESNLILLGLKQTYGIGSDSGLASRLLSLCTVATELGLRPGDCLNHSGQ